MSTAVDTAFEEIVAAFAETAGYRHAICAVCFPDLDVLPAEVVTICGRRMASEAWRALRGQPAKCSTCAAVPVFPCGH